MDNQDSKRIHLGRGADFAFILVVLSAYFAMFSSLPNVSVYRLISMITLGVAYVTLGIYGFPYFLESKNVIYQLAYFVIQLLLGGLILLIGSGSGLTALLLLPLVVQSVVMLPNSWMLIVNIGILIIYSLGQLRLTQNLSALLNNLPVFFVGQIFIVFFTQMAVTEERSRAEIERLVTELEDANNHLREYALNVEELAVTRERNRLAREIHDGLGHYLTSIYMQVQAAKAVMRKDESKAEDALGKAQKLAQDALSDVRHSVSTLRSPMLENMALSDAVRNLMDHTESGQMEIELIIRGQERLLSPQVNWGLFRAIQESMNNALKYSEASEMKIILDYEKQDTVSLEIKDDGQGADDVSGGYGLIGLQERINLLRGSCEIVTSQGGGFLLKIGVPG